MGKSSINGQFSMAMLNNQSNDYKDAHGDEENSSTLIRLAWLFTSHVPIGIRWAHTYTYHMYQVYTHTQIYLYINVD